MKQKNKWLFINQSTDKKSNNRQTAQNWYRFGDKVTVMRNGQYVATWA